MPSAAAALLPSDLSSLLCAFPSWEPGSGCVHWEPGWQSPCAAPATNVPAHLMLTRQQLGKVHFQAFPLQGPAVARGVQEWSPLNAGSVPLKEAAAAAFVGSAHTLWAAGAANTFFPFYALRSSCDLFPLDLFGSFSPWEGSRMGVFQPMHVLLCTSWFAFTFIWWMYPVRKCLESFLGEVALPGAVNIPVCHLQIKI